MSLASSIITLGALFGNAEAAPAAPPTTESTPEQTPAPASDKAPQAAPTKAEKESSPLLLPIELTGFGDIYYGHESEEHDDFHIGSLEVDVALELVPFVTAFAGIAYDPEAQVMTLASFTVDSGLWGAADHNLLKSDWIDSSGLILGKFDVPFGIAYLQYGSPDNRLVTLPEPVAVTHDGWNDLGAQFYVSAPLVNVIGYWVNGTGLPEVESGAAHSAVGGRLGLKPLGRSDCGCTLELGGSGARTIGETATLVTLAGADVSAAVGGLDVRNELIHMRYDDGARMTGAYSQGVYTIDPVFFGARYAVSRVDGDISERTATGSAGLEVFPQGEVRVAYERGLEQHSQAFFVQIVGGTGWKPTGFRR